MAKIFFAEKSFLQRECETVLEALLRHGVDYPNACRSGACQACLTKLRQGVVAPSAQVGLKPTLAAQNYFLACQCRDNADLHISLPDDKETAIEAEITELTKLNHNVLKVCLKAKGLDSFHAGQYINLIRQDNLIRSYSISNIPQDMITLQIKLIKNGLMSLWLSQKAKVGDGMLIRGPMGNCFYHNPTKENYPIILLGTGTGAAPLIGILQDALSQQHQEKIIFIHGGRQAADLYLTKKLKALEKQHTNLIYEPCIFEKCSKTPIDCLNDILKKHVTVATHFFVCGSPELTKKMMQIAFLLGVASKNIFSDSFFPSA